MNKLFHDDCLEAMSSIPDNSVDLVLTDLPYGITNNSWDHVIPPHLLWEHYERVIKPNGCVVLTAAQPFASLLISSNISMFKYDLIWQKTIASGQLNVKKQPLRTHEHILVFYKKPPKYNEQKTKGEPYSISRKGVYKNDNYNEQKSSTKINDGYRHATSVIKVSNPRIRGGHPTQKPVELLEKLILMYSDHGQVVLDSCMGSASTGIACINTGRIFIGIEKDANYFDMSVNNLKNALGDRFDESVIIVQ